MCLNIGLYCRYLKSGMTIQSPWIINSKVHLIVTLRCNYLPFLGFGAPYTRVCILILFTLDTLLQVFLWCRARKALWHVAKRNRAPLSGSRHWVNRLVWLTNISSINSSNIQFKNHYAHMSQTLMNGCLDVDIPPMRIFFSRLFKENRTNNVSVLTTIPRLVWHYCSRRFCNPPSNRTGINKADFRFAPNQWETALLSNDVSHWLGTSLESALSVLINHRPLGKMADIHFKQHLHNSLNYLNRENSFVCTCPTGNTYM